MVNQTVRTQLVESLKLINFAKVCKKSFFFTILNYCSGIAIGAKK